MPCGARSPDPAPRGDRTPDLSAQGVPSIPCGVRGVLRSRLSRVSRLEPARRAPAPRSRLASRVASRWVVRRGPETGRVGTRTGPPTSGTPARGSAGDLLCLGEASHALARLDRGPALGSRLWQSARLGVAERPDSGAVLMRLCSDRLAVAAPQHQDRREDLVRLKLGRPPATHVVLLSSPNWTLGSSRFLLRTTRRSS